MVKPSGSLMEDALFDPHNHFKLPKTTLGRQLSMWMQSSIQALAISLPPLNPSYLENLEPPLLSRAILLDSGPTGWVNTKEAKTHWFGINLLLSTLFENPPLHSEISHVNSVDSCNDFLYSGTLRSPRRWLGGQWRQRLRVRRRD